MIFGKKIKELREEHGKLDAVIYAQKEIEAGVG